MSVSASVEQQLQHVDMAPLCSGHEGGFTPACGLAQQVRPPCWPSLLAADEELNHLRGSWVRCRCLLAATP